MSIIIFLTSLLRLSNSDILIYSLVFSLLTRPIEESCNVSQSPAFFPHCEHEEKLSITELILEGAGGEEDYLWVFLS